MNVENQTKTPFTNSTPTDAKDEILWEVARKRAGFKWSLVSYLIVNTLLIAVWLLTSGPNTYFWPIWPLLGWGVGVAFHYFGAYYGSNMFSVEQEYNKLKNKQDQKF